MSLDLRGKQLIENFCGVWDKIQNYKSQINNRQNL